MQELHHMSSDCNQQAREGDAVPCGDRGAKTPCVMCYSGGSKPQHRLHTHTRESVPIPVASPSVRLPTGPSPSAVNRGGRGDRRAKGGAGRRDDVIILAARLAVVPSTAVPTHRHTGEIHEGDDIAAATSAQVNPTHRFGGLGYVIYVKGPISLSMREQRQVRWCGCVVWPWGRGHHG